ncbi:Bacterial Ig-like domain (group 2) [compost metagenome]
MTPSFLRPAAAIAALIGLAACTADTTFSGNSLMVPVPGASQAPQAVRQDAPAPASPGATIAPVQRVVKDITIQPESFVITEGSAHDVVVIVTYTDGTYDSNVTWSSSDSTVVSVNPTTGRLAALKQGVASVVAQSPLDKAKKASSTVSVRPAEVTSVIARVTPAEATIKVGETIRLQAELQLSNGKVSPNVIWQSTNTNLASVTNGLVTGIKPGTVTVTAMAQDEPTKLAKSTITITE